MKRIKGIIGLIIGVMVIIPSSVLATNYNNGKNDFKVNIPDTYYVIDEDNVEENRTFIESYGLFPENIREIFETSEEVMLGLRSDELVTIHVVVSKDNDSKRLWNTEKTKQKELDKYKNQVKGKVSTGENEVVQQEYSEGNRFLKTVVEYEDHTNIYYNTIQNGKYYEIRYETYDIENKEETGKEIEEIQNTFRFTKTEDKPPLEIEWLKITLIVVAFVALLGILYESNKLSKKLKTSSKKK